MHHPKNIKSNGFLSAWQAAVTCTIQAVNKLSYEMCLKADLKQNILTAL